MDTEHRGIDLLSKVPEVTLAFWIIKICATTLGETGGDAFSMTLNLGYAVSTLIFLGFFLVVLLEQVVARRFHAFLYWAVVVATTTVGTTTSDYLDRTLGLGYLKSSIMEFAGVLAVLLVWRMTMGGVQFEDIEDRKDEIFYWVTILVSNTLGTALGDMVATRLGLGFERGALIFAALIAVVALLHYFTSIPAGILFWATYVLTRPLGATLGDLLDKPHTQGGLQLGRFAASGVIGAAMIVGIVLTEMIPRWKARREERALRS